jgi:hypothetical protein
MSRAPPGLAVRRRPARAEPGSRYSRYPYVPFADCSQCLRRATPEWTPRRRYSRSSEAVTCAESRICGSRAPVSGGASPCNRNQSLSASADLVASSDHLLGDLQVIIGSDANLEIPGAEVADAAYIAKYTAGKVNPVRVNLHVHKNVTPSGVNLNACEVLEAPKREVVLELLLRHVIAERQRECFECLEALDNCRRSLREIVSSRLLWGGGGACWRSGLDVAARSGGVDQFEQQQLSAVLAIPNEFDTAVYLFNRMLVVAREVSSDAQEAWGRPLDSCLTTESLSHECLELSLMVEQPVEIKQTLVDDVFTGRPFVLDDYRRAILIQPQGVDTATMLLPGGVLARQETDSEKDVQVLLDEVLEGLFKRSGPAIELPSLSSLGETGDGPAMTELEGEMGTHEDDRIDSP